MPTQRQSDNARVRNVRAQVDSPDVTRPPKITFTFPGLNDPIRLWAELQELGWHVPDRPPPEAEIDWDAADGAAYRVAPFMVENFNVIAQDWPGALVAERSLNTINVLRRLGVDLDIPIAYLAFLRRTQVEILKDPSRKAFVDSRPASIPTTLMLSRQPFSVLVDEASVVVYETAVAPGQRTWYWVESNRHPDDLGRSVKAQDAVFESIEMGWELINRVDGPRASSGQDRILRFIVQDVVDGTEMVARLQDLVGEQCASMIMRPIQRTVAVTNCLLVVAVVPKERFADIGSQMISEFPDAIGRGRSYTAPAASAA